MPIEHMINSALGKAGLRLVKTSNRRTVNDFLRSRNIDLVIDVGANEGQFGQHLRTHGYTGRILSFEPLSDAYAKLSDSAKKHGPWETFNMGLSDKNEETEINVSKNTVFSSLKTLNDHAATFDANSTAMHKEKIRLRTLDEVMKNNAAARPFLKIDTQGYEEHVLKGGLATLPHAYGVMMELPIQHLYHQVWNAEDAIAFMRKQGFSISNIIPVSYDDHNDDVSLLEVDCIFKNNNLT